MKPEIKRAPRSAAKKVQAKPPLTILDACDDPGIFGPWFEDKQTWAAWFVVLKAMFGLPLDDADLALFQKHTGRTTPAPGGYFDLSLVVGRRGGKSLILALIAAFLSCFFDWRPFLTGGERAVIMIIAADKRQAATIFKYFREMLDIPLLKGIIDRETNELLELTNPITIEIQTASYKTVRGRTVVAALCDELAFWSVDEGTANPDSEIINALRPAMATIPGARLLKASSPYARKGVLWNDYKKHFGAEESPTLVWQASTREMNPSVPQSFIDAAYEDDASNAEAEYGGQFRSDVEAFVSADAVEACVVQGRFELPPVADIEYTAFVDPSGGSADSMTLAIAHREGEKVVVDAVRENKPPFSPEGVVSEHATLLKTYRITKVTGDHYAGLWPRERYAAHGITYMAAAKPKSDLYRDLLPLVNGARIELLDHQKSINQLCALERKTARSGKDSIDHPPKQHDDVINAVAGAAVHAHTAKKPMTFATPFVASGGPNLARSFDMGLPPTGTFDFGSASMPPGGWPNPANKR
jgi:hypothetical protein